MTPPIRLSRDSYVYDRLAKDDDVRHATPALVLAHGLVVVPLRTVVEELARSPFRGLPRFFPIQATETVHTSALARSMTTGPPDRT